jgi:hypothetical protein
MNDPTLTCPHCNQEIKLTESLAAPLIQSAKQSYEKQIDEMKAQIAKREAAVRDQKTANDKDRESINQRVSEQVADLIKKERAAIAEAEFKKAKDQQADEIAKVREEITEAKKLITDREAKLSEARQNELLLRRERQELHDEKEQFELEKQRAIDAERAKIRESAQKDADEQNRLRLAEKDKTIESLHVKLQDALRKAEQGSQQLQGEVQELQLEMILRNEFPMDAIDPVPKGEHGGDILHRVCSSYRKACGTILWESKRTKSWSEGWLSKLRDDQRAAKAELAIIVSQTLPKNVTNFGLLDGVLVTSSQCLVPVAIVLRQWIIELAGARQVREGQQTKMEMTYEYLMGPHFKHRVEAIAENLRFLQEDLEKERKFLGRQWAKREKQLHRVIESTWGMYGDLQGIAGIEFPEIEGLENKMLENKNGQLD